MLQMENELVNFLSKNTLLSSELINIIVETSDIRSYKKGTVLLREGELSNECFLILKGCIRSYFIKDGEEIIIEFYTEEQPVSPINFGNKLPSKHYLECIEDTKDILQSNRFRNVMPQNLRPQIHNNKRTYRIPQKRRMP